MNRPPKNLLDLPLEERALMALRSAVKEAIAEQHAKGLPVYVWRDGKVVELKPRAQRKPRRTHRRGASARVER